MRPRPLASFTTSHSMMMSCSVKAEVGGGNHVYKDIWAAFVGEEFPCKHENGNRVDPFPVAVMRGDAVIGHIPRNLYVLSTYAVMAWSEIHGCKQSVHVCWPLKTSKMASAGWSNETLSSLCLQSTYGTLSSCLHWTSDLACMSHANHLETCTMGGKLRFCLGRSAVEVETCQSLHHRKWL